MMLLTNHLSFIEYSQAMLLCSHPYWKEANLEILKHVQSVDV